MNLINAVLFGSGALNWDGKERRSDRYGSVALVDTNSENKLISPGASFKKQIASDYIGRNGALVAKIIETRESTHIGDLFRGFAPSTPSISDHILLGNGKLFIEEYQWATAVGLTPEDGRKTDWLNPEALYKCHEQTVELYFIPS